MPNHTRPQFSPAIGPWHRRFPETAPRRAERNFGQSSSLFVFLLVRPKAMGQSRRTHAPNSISSHARALGYIEPGIGRLLPTATMGWQTHPPIYTPLLSRYAISEGLHETRSICGAGLTAYGCVIGKYLEFDLFAWLFDMAFGEFYFILPLLMLLACSRSQRHLKQPPPKRPAFDAYFVSAAANPQPSAATSSNTSSNTSKHQLPPIHSSAVYLAPAHSISAN